MSRLFQSVNSHPLNGMAIGERGADRPVTARLGWGGGSFCSRVTGSKHQHGSSSRHNGVISIPQIKPKTLTHCQYVQTAKWIWISIFIIYKMISQPHHDLHFTNPGEPPPKHPCSGAVQSRDDMRIPRRIVSLGPVLASLTRI